METVVFIVITLVIIYLVARRKGRVKKLNDGSIVLARFTAKVTEKYLPDAKYGVSWVNHQQSYNLYRSGTIGGAGFLTKVPKKYNKLLSGQHLGSLEVLVKPYSGDQAEVYILLRQY